MDPPCLIGALHIEQRGGMKTPQRCLQEEVSKLAPCPTANSAQLGASQRKMLTMLTASSGQFDHRGFRLASFFPFSLHLAVLPPHLTHVRRPRSHGPRVRPPRWLAHKHTKSHLLKNTQKRVAAVGVEGNFFYEVFNPALTDATSTTPSYTSRRV